MLWRFLISSVGRKREDGSFPGLGPELSGFGGVVDYVSVHLRADGDRKLGNTHDCPGPPALVMTA